MKLTLAEIDEFRDFAIRKVNNGGVESLAECLRLWEDQREYEESIAALKESLGDSAAGRTKPVDQAFADIRRELGLPEEQPAS